MLILSRERNQTINLNTQDGPIKLMVVRICGRQVKLGIEAPPSVSITRPDAKRQTARPLTEAEMNAFLARAAAAGKLAEAERMLDLRENGG